MTFHGSLALPLREEAKVSVCSTSVEDWLVVVFCAVVVTVLAVVSTVRVTVTLCGPVIATDWFRPKGLVSSSRVRFGSPGTLQVMKGPKEPCSVL